RRSTCRTPPWLLRCPGSSAGPAWPCPGPWPHPCKAAGRQRRSSWLSWTVLGSGALLKIGDPDLHALVARRARGIGLVVLDGAWKVLQIQVTQHAQVLVNHGEVRVFRERLLVDRPGFGEAPAPAVQQCELVGSHRVVRLDGQRLLEPRLGQLGLVGLLVDERQ